MEKQQELKAVCNIVSERIQEAINNSGLTLKQLEQCTGLSKSAIQRYASGDVKKIPLYAVVLIAKATKSNLLCMLLFSLDTVCKNSDNE